MIPSAFEPRSEPTGPTALRSRRALTPIRHFAGASPATGLGLPIGSALRSVTRCGVCGFSEVRTDEVLDRGRLLLAECPRCEHRWTARPDAPGVVRPHAEGDEEVASAA
jgi:hypothetical protein